MSAASSSPPAWRVKLARAFGRGAILTLFSLLLVTYVAGPVGWLVSSSLQSEADITAVPPNWLPPKVTFGNFEAIFTAGKREVTYETRYQGDAATGRFLPSGAENLPRGRNRLVLGLCGRRTLAEASDEEGQAGHRDRQPRDPRRHGRLRVPLRPNPL